jgi:uncharacterized protein YcfJ
MPGFPVIPFMKLTRASMRWGHIFQGKEGSIPMNKLMIAAIAAAVAVPAGISVSDSNRVEIKSATATAASFDQNRRYREWKGRDGRYYCTRPDGTTGLLVGGVAGALVGRTIDTRGDRTLGTVLGAGAGALVGREVERSGQKRECRAQRRR